ncbi:sodium-dependent neutral amino acid transporter B(0)AT1-like [Periophthalmus magnuspinnatus]|uniref:sodium-dependent neutral amino acid transporter B(0)AT1-like n=1 Tax=Periophthalmus magnuspinnatus TaxID=409849 RepID=UPI00145A0892|nr:sodium-dependent neutral amino acid transporter B(0)AT1-like [Periophthalmus magnuspinnatus]
MKLLIPNPGLDKRIHTYDDLERMDREQVEDRPKWDNKAQYILTCVGFCIGIGNVWRFPYLCQSHGGGAFLIPYLILLVLEGLPLLFMEFAIGQRMRKGSVEVWRDINPYLTGIGIASMLVSLLIGLYYNTLIAWIVWYLFNSFQSPLPWTQCPLNENQTGYIAECQQSSTVDYFFYRVTLNTSTSISDSGGIHWPVVACLLVAWTVIWLCYIRGISSSGKAVYVTTLLPYFVLVIFLVRGVTLKGAWTGVKFLFTPDVEELIKPVTWLNAGAQVFFSLGIGWGGLICFSSYNPLHNNCRNDALMLSVVSASTATFAATVTYTIIGFRATQKYETCMNDNIGILMNAFDVPESYITPENYDKVFNLLNSTDPATVMGLDITSCDLQTFLRQGVEGPGLAFIVFAEAINNMPVAPVWSVLFFVMLLCLGLSSLIGTFEGVLVPLRDLHVFPKKCPQEAVTGITFLAAFFITLLFAQRSGMYWVSLFDAVAGSVPSLFIGLVESIIVVYVYGINRFNEDIKFMIGSKPGIFWQVTWRFVSPLIMLVILIFYLVTQAQGELTYLVWDPSSDNFPSLASVPYPDWVYAVVFLLAGVPSLVPPFYALCRVIYNRCNKNNETQKN